MSYSTQNSLAAWLDGSAFVSNGEPAVWYHGTDTTDDFNIFASWSEGSIGFHFGSAPTASARLSTTRLPDDPDSLDGLRIIPVYCRAQRPLRLKDHHCWRIDRVASELTDLGLIEPEIEDEIAEGCDEFALFAAIEAAGYDCVLYANETESEGRFDDSLIVWRPELVKSVFAPDFRPAEVRIMPGLPDRSWDLERWKDNSDRLEAAIRSLAAPSPSPL